jgi:hypothetical protein
MAARPTRSSPDRLSISVDFVNDSDFLRTHAPPAPPAPPFATPPPPAPPRDDLEPLHIRSEEQPSPFFVRQHDILDDGLPPPPRAGWPTRHVDVYVRLHALANLPSAGGPAAGGGRPHFSVELRLADSVYKNPPCPSDGGVGCALDQEVRVPLDEAALAAATSTGDAGGPGPCLTATCYDCALFSETDVVGSVSFRVADVLRLSPGWHEAECRLAARDGETVVGPGGEPTTLGLAFLVDEGSFAKVRAPRGGEG